MGMMLDVTCADCGNIISYNEGAGILPLDLDAEVAKKRKAIRDQVAKLKALIVPEDWRALDRRLYRCAHCGWVHDRLVVSFQCRDSEGIHTYVADEICHKCQRPLQQLQPFDLFPCPKCQHGEMKTTEGGSWD